MINEFDLKYYINILGKDNYIEEYNEDNFTIISDIQIWQLNLLKYEFEARVKKLNLFEGTFEEFKNLYNEDWKTKEQYKKDKEFLEWILKQSDLLFIEKYLNLISKKDNLIDLWDFAFNLNDKRLEFLKSYNAFQKLRDWIKKIKWKSYLTIWNHDKDLDKLKPIFNKISYYFWTIQNNKLIIFTHYPITERTIKLPFHANIKELINNWVEIINYHWHVHSNIITVEFDWIPINWVTLKNFSMDKLILEDKI